MNVLIVFRTAFLALFSVAKLVSLGKQYHDRGKLDYFFEQKIPRFILLITPLLYVSIVLLTTTALYLTATRSLQTHVPNNRVLVVVAAIPILLFALNLIWINFIGSIPNFDARKVQVNSMQYYIVGVAVLQTTLWIVDPGQPRHEPLATMSLFAAAAVTYFNQQVLKRHIYTEDMSSSPKQVVARLLDVQ